MNPLTTNVEDIVIVSRHPAAIQFVREELRSRGFDAELVPVIAQATNADVLGKHVIGNLPLNLASHALCVTAIEFDSPPRGLEYSLEDMKKAGAKLTTYVVLSVKPTGW